MPTFDGAKLPTTARLSDYLDKPNDAVRLTGLRLGQTVEIDVGLDGGYTQPAHPPQFGWVSPVTGLGGVHTALLSITKSDGFGIYCSDKAEIQNSRGRGVSISECSEFSIADLWVRGARTAGIAFSDCHNFEIDRPVTIDTGNYQSAKNQGKNYPGSIKLEGSTNYTIRQPASIAHMGNGMTPTETANGKWIEPFCYQVDGAQIYINASPGHTVTGGLVIGRATAYVVNSEDNHVGASEDVTFAECCSLDSEWAVGFWGNQKKPDIVIERAAVTGCILISDEGIKIHPNANITALDRTGTLWLHPADLTANVLANLRMLADRVAGLYLVHADQLDIDGARSVLAAAFAALRGPTEPDEPTAEELLRAWLAEGETLPAQLASWLERGRALVG